MLHQKIQKEVAEAMKEKNEVRRETLRSVLAGITNELISQKRKPNEEMNDEDVLKVIKKQVKQRKDSVEQFMKGERNDLAEKERAELSILETYLPPEISSEEIKKIALRKKDELGITDKSKMGILMGAVMKELKGNADGNTVKKITEELF